MKVGVFGHHPDLFPGFNALMSANFSYGLAQLGHDVTLLLPNTEEKKQQERLARLNLTTSEIDHFDTEGIDIRVIEVSEDIGAFDLIVWQTYFKHDEIFWPKIRSAATVVAKNFPRLLIGEPTRDLRVLKGVTDRFDLIGLALREDYNIAQTTFPDSEESAFARCFYQPRGFRADWLENGNTEQCRPVFGIEKGVDTKGAEYSYLVPVIDRIKQIHGDVDVICARFNDPRFTTEKLPLLPAREFYRRFIAPLWAYLMIDVEPSRQSKNAVTVKGRRIYPGMYENQIVEAQLAGAVVAGHEEALPQELIASTNTGLRFADHNDTSTIVSFLDSAIRERETVSAEAKSWAAANHSVQSMVKPLIAQVEGLAVDVS